ncbi:hypothetical protein ES702_02960 [subsurface metagenome]
MSNCIRENDFLNELHLCFKINCNSKFYPVNAKTCKICNWKKCNKGHCGCSVSQETRNRLRDFYNLFCNKNHSKETSFALKTMLITFYRNCLKCM